MASDRPILFGKYQLLSQIARGGMAEVWKAKAHGVEGFEKVLVIKRILPDLSENPRFVEMFINEAKIAVTLSHANIVQVFDLGHADGSYFIAMEYVAGMDLAATLKLLSRGPQQMAPELAVYITSELVKGLDYAHRRRDDQGSLLNIVHRDVSPQNVLLSFEGEVKLTDFGIAKARSLAQAVTELGVVKGKYSYMAPEQLMGGALDARADVFAAGILLYECLTGENPFQANSTYDTLQRIRSGDVTPVQSLAPAVDDEVAAIVKRAMAFDPADRYETAGHLYEDLIQFLYSSGKHFGARVLSEQLRTLQTCADEGNSLSEGLRQAFEEEPVPSEAPTRRPQTPTETPVTPGTDPDASEHTRVARRITRDAPPLTPHRQRTESRSVTALVVTKQTGDDLKAETVQALVERFGGTLCSREGTPDNWSQLYVLFGDQVPDGRDSDNAARCALRVARAATAAAAQGGGETSVTISVHAGRVLIDLEGGLVRDDEFRGLLAVAGRLAASANAGQVLVDAASERELRGRFRLVPAGAASGGRQPGHLLVSERSATDSHGRFIGRRDILSTIGTALAAANRGTLQVIGLTGEAGSGKSRLLIETMRRLKLAGHDAGLYVATLTPQMREVPLSAVQEMLRMVLGVDEFDPESLLRDRTTRLRELGLVQAEQTAIAGILGLQTHATAGPPRERPLRAALARIVRRLAEDRLTIFAWDGSEYIDAESTSLIDDLLRSVAEARVAAILSYRPGFATTWRELPTFSEVQVGPLADDEVARLTATRLGADEIPFELLREVTTKSGGNPLYVEEYLKALQEAGAVTFEEGQVVYQPAVAQVNVPKTLRGIIASRIARLDPDTRYILQVASLSGERFKTRVIAAAADEDVEHIDRALEGKRMRGIISNHGPKEHAFAHALVRQVVAEGITLTARKEIHGALGAALKRIYPDREEELAERLARHYEAADQPERAVQCLVLAATRFEDEGSLDSAVAALQHAIELRSGEDDDDLEYTFALYERIAGLTFRSRRLLEGAEALRRAVKRAEMAKADRWLARFCMWRGRLLAAASRIEEGRRWLDQAQNVARGLTDASLFRDVFLATADVDARRGDFERAVGFLREALQLANDLDDESRLKCLLPLSLTYARMGDHDAALRTLTEIKDLGTSAESPSVACQLWRLEAQIYYHAREQEASARAAAKAVEVAREAGMPYEAALNANHMGEAYLRLGDHRRAFAALRHSFEVASERGYERLQMSNLRALGYIDATRFGSDEGRSRVAKAVAYAEAHDYVWDIIQGKYFMAVIEQARGEVQSARLLIRQVLDLAAQHGHRKYTEDAEEALRNIDEGVAIGLPE
ncbi:MAG: protein kinase [Myxococcales bacterium]|nr:protein kinase [Myxococcales bacterium]